MKKELCIQIMQEPCTYHTHIPFSSVPAWFDTTQRALVLNLILPRERTNEKRPLLIWLCGGAFSQMNLYVWMAELAFYAYKGLAVASVEYRVGPEAPFPAALIDVKAAIRFLRAHAKEYGLDESRFVIMGESAGGQLASLAGLTRGEKEFEQGEYLGISSAVQGVVDLYGPSDIREFDDPTPWHPFWLRQFCLGKTEEETALLRYKASPVTYIRKRTEEEKIPFLIFHGDADPLVPFSQSSDFYEQLSTNGYPADFMVISGGGHGSGEFYQPVIKEQIAEFISASNESSGRAHRDAKYLIDI